jgi:ubiquinone/menaquinone biosynthesis C-methylase UbiE
MTVDRAGKFAFDYSPPEGYDYFPESGEKVLDEQEISSLLNDEALSTAGTQRTVRD